MNWFRDDPALGNRVRRLIPDVAAKDAESTLGRWGQVAEDRVDPNARLADRHPPIHHPYDRDGNRIDEVEFHPSYLAIRHTAVENGLVAAAYEPFGPLSRTPRALVFAAGYLFGQAECGYYCPVAMTDALARVLTRHAPRDMAERYVTRLAGRDPKHAFEGAMFLTEKAGGSDVGRTETTAREEPDGTWRLTGFKWFCSNATADLILTLARPAGAPAGTRGLGLFLMPRIRPDGTRNRMRLERLKEKLGVVSMPTGEMTLDGAFAWMLAPPGEGFHGMADMMNLCRLHNAVASVAIVRRAFREAVTHARTREAFGKRVIDHPLQQVGLARLAVASEGAIAGVLEAGELMDRADAGDEVAAKALRALTPVAKSATARLAVDGASQACEALGGNGYIEDFVTPRLLRDAQVLPIWEGTTNVLALDLARSHRNDQAPAALAALAREMVNGAPADLSDLAGLVDRTLADILGTLDGGREETYARAADRLFHAWATAVLIRDAADDARLGTVARAYAAWHVDAACAPPDPEGFSVASFDALVEQALPGPG